MKLAKNVDLADFLRTVNRCAGDVYFSTEQGDHLNLKSIMSQYIFSAATGDRKLLLAGDITYADAGDSAMLLPYLSADGHA